MSSAGQATSCAAVVAAALAVAAGPGAAAEEKSRHRLFFGTDISVIGRFAYSGAVMAPMGGLDRPGLRIRAYGGAGRYELAGGTWVDKQAGHLLAGWATWRDNHGITVYAGIAGEHHDAPATQSKHGTELGAAVLAETWWRTGPQTVVSASAGYADVYDDVSGRVAVTYDLTGHIGLIAEARGGHDSDGSYWAAGAGITAKTGDLEAALIAGAAGDEDDSGYSFRAEVAWRR